MLNLVIGSLRVKNAVTLLFFLALPSFAHSIPKSILQIDGKSALGTPTSAKFGIGIYNTVSRRLVETASIEDLVTIRGYISPASKDIGKAADVYVIAVSGENYFIRNSAGAFSPFNIATDTLIPAFEEQMLSSDLEVDFFTAKVGVIGTFQFFTAYRPSGSQDLIYSAVGGDVKVTLPGRWRTDKLDWIDYNFNKNEKLCDDPLGICAGWVDDAPQDCIENYKFGITAASTEVRLQYASCINHIVFKPYISKILSRVIESPLPKMIEEANRLTALGWDKQVMEAPEFFIASDIPAGLVLELKEGIAEAEKYLGRWGPAKVYVVGNQLEPALPVIDAFCQSNWKGYAEQIDYCIKSDQGKDMREMATIYPGSNGFQQSSWFLEKPINSYVLNPAADSENRFTWSSGDNPDMEKSTLLHEYFHVYQGSHLIYRGGNENTPVGWGMPRWFEESAAVYFQIVLGEKLGWQFRSNMNQQIGEIVANVSNFRAKFPGVTIEDLETEEGTKRLQRFCVSCYGSVQYDYGVIGMKMLAVKTSDEKVFFDYYKSAKVEGWMKAFETTFGLTVAQFYQELEALLRKPIPKQIEELKANQ